MKRRRGATAKNKIVVMARTSGIMWGPFAEPSTGDTVTIPVTAVLPFLTPLKVDLLAFAKDLMFQDARDYQICFLSLFLALGLCTKDWTLRPEVIISAIATALLVQYIASQTQADDIPPWTASIRSALITGLSLSLLLRTDHWYTMAFAAAIAILSKFLIRVKGKHVFNPANVGVIAALVLTQDAWVSPGQWGQLGWYAFLFVGAGGIVLQRVGRWDTSAMFLATYGGLMLVRNAWLGWSWDVVFHHLMNGSLMLFALFMITDPRSIPDARVGRLIWAIAIGVFTFVLQTQFLISSAIFWALFCLAPVTALLDLAWPSIRFKWNVSSTTLQETT
jgi:Na+-transporting NADH:ubiquinone oxidoreductase subunit NqrB